MDEEKALEILNEDFSVPSAREICDEALKKCLGRRSRDKLWIKKNFSLLVEKVQLEAYQIYQNHERIAGAKALQRLSKRALGGEISPEKLDKFYREHFWALDRYFLGLTQGRRPRAGKTFENIIKSLFETLEYPHTSQPLIDGQPDFLLPSINHYAVNPVDCLIFTAKRTLRERWRQVTTEGTKGFMFFLATIDDKVGEKDLKELLANRVYLVVPKKVKKNAYLKNKNVISFESFFRHYLDPAMTRWKDNGVI